MKWFLNLFKKNSNETFEATSEDDRKRRVGFDSFETGQELYFNKKANEALPHFDKAIQNGYVNAEAYEFRANCLNELEYFYDSIEDFNISIQKDSEKQNVYYM